MNAFYLEGASVSSSSQIQQLKHLIKQQKQPVNLGVPSMFNSSIRIKNLLELSLMHQSLGDHIDQQLDELRNEHVLFVYDLLQSSNQTSALIYVQQYFNVLEDRFKAVQVLRELSEKTISNCQLLLEQISAQIISHFLNENEVSVANKSMENAVSVQPLSELNRLAPEAISAFPLAQPVQP